LKSTQQYRVTPDLYARIFIEFLTENTVIQTDKQMAAFFDTLNFGDDMPIRIFIGYRSEQGIWK
jgi:hypothetical protein